MGTIKLPIDDILVVHREVEIPDECPHCGADLRDKLEVFERQIHLRAVDVNDDGTLNYYHNTEGFDGEYATEWRCMKCSKWLVTNNEVELDYVKGEVPGIVSDVFFMMDRRTLDARKP